MSEEKNSWLERGKEHEAQGRLADAVWCFEKAVKEPQSSQEAFFLLGRSWQKLGSLEKAYAAWRRGNAAHPNEATCLLAMAETLLSFGKMKEAAGQAEAVLKINEDECRAETLCAIVEAWQGEVLYWEKLEQWAEDRQAVIGDNVFARALAIALQTKDAQEEAKQRFSERCLSMDVSWPPVLKMAMLSKILLLPLQRTFYADKARALLDETLPEQDSESVRMLALVLRDVGCLDVAKAFLRRYGEIQKAVYERRLQQADVLPVQWRRRTAGTLLRTAWLLPPWNEEKTGVRKHLSALSSCKADVWVLGDTEHWQSFLGSANHAQEGVEEKTVRSLTDAPVAALNMRDYDVLVDFVGLDWPMGTFFAEQPARQVWAFAEDQKGLQGVLSWWDRVFETPQALQEVLLEQEVPQSASLSAREFIEKKDEALKAHQQQDWATAGSIYGVLLKDQPEMALPHYLSALLARDKGEREKAVAHFLDAVAALPGCARPYQALGELLLEEDIERSQALVEKGLSIMPEAESLCFLEGEIALRRGEYEKAENIFRRLVSVQPMNADAHLNVGLVLQQQGRHQEAARSCQRALLFNPDLLEAHFHLGALFQEQGQWAAAIKAFRHVLSKQPKHVESYTQLNRALAATGQLRDWFESFRNFQTNCPQSIVMAAQALDACQYMGDFKGIEFFLEGLRTARFKAESKDELVKTLALLQYQLLCFDVEPEFSLQVAQLYDQAMQATFGEPLSMAQERKPGKIRLGYLSADLWDHVMGKMMWEAVRHHDKDQFELFFYSLSGRQDSCTDQFRQLADHFLFLPGLGERELANRIAEDDLDILVDLSSHTVGSRPGILALKPARVQITHIANAGTVGLSAIDFKLTDEDADLPEMQPWQIETFLPMKGCVYPCIRAEMPEEHPYHRASLGIPEEAVLIGAFVMPPKLSARCVALWKQVLEKIPQGKLVFSPLSPFFIQTYQNIMRSAGIDESRYIFLSMPKEKALLQARYAMMDFVLDTMPYGGVNGMLEPLNAGVPVVTLVGRRHGERSGYSILKNLGETRTVAHGGKEYVEIAERLAHDKAFMADVRAGIRRGMEQSPLVDMKQHCRHLEEAYLRALEMKQRAIQS